MTTKVYAARTQTDVYTITEEMKLAARKRYSEQRAKRPPKQKEDKRNKPVVQAPVAKKKK